LDAGAGVPHGFTEFLKSIDVVVMGRRTFEVVRKLGVVPLYGGRPLIVLSSRPLDLSLVKIDVAQMAGTPKQIISKLQKRGFRHAYLDGGLTIQRFFRAGLVNRITVTRVPVLIGQGIPLFGPLPHDLCLRHIKTRSFPKGLVQSVYELVTSRRSSAKTKSRSSHAKKRKRRK
jgi:dihydrofolate reductase